MSRPACREGLQSGLQVVRGEQAGDPGVQVWQEVGLAEVDGGRVVERLGGSVLAREQAAVGGLLVDPVALHPRLAQTQRSRRRSRAVLAAGWDR